MLQRIRNHYFFPLFLLFSLVLLSGIGVTLPIPNIVNISTSINFEYLGFIEAAFVLISILFIIIWGYLVDKFDRKTLLFFSIIIWVFPSILIASFPFSIQIYFFGRILMAIGLSALSPLSYSILGDYAIYQERGFLSSGLNLAWVGSSAIGILIGALFSFCWNLSFAFIAVLGIILMIWQLFLIIPERGRQEPFFVKIENYHYPFRITISGIITTLHSRTILGLLIQGFFALIPGTIFTYSLISFLSSGEGLLLNIGQASIFALVIASGRALGYPIFGKIGDYLTLKNGEPRIRAILAALCMAGQAVFFFIAFILLNDNLVSILIFAGFFWIGSFIGAASGPNRTSLMFEVSFPEHRGSLGSLFSLTDQLGEVFGLVFSTFFLNLYSYVEVFIFSLVFYLIASFVWSLTINKINADRSAIKVRMEARKSIIQASGINSGS